MNKIEFLYNKDKYQGIDSSKALSHYGILGQKWGQRRWQNADGTFNEAGKERYFGPSGTTKKNSEDNKKNWSTRAEDYSTRLQKAKTHKDINKIEEEILNDSHIKKYYDKVQKMYNETGDWDKCAEYIKKTPIQKEDWIYDMVEQHVTKDQKIGGRSNDFPYRWNNGNMFNINYQNPDGSLTKKGLKLLNRAAKHPKLFNTKNLIDEDYYDKWKKDLLKDYYKTDEEKENSEKEKQAEVQNKINEIKSSYKIDKNLSGDKITVKEFKDIIDELNNFDKRDFERNHREEYNKVADMGIDALNKAEGYDEHEVGDDGTRMWFMWEDQTDGLGEIAYLRSKGYSKDYVKQYLESPLPEEIEEIRDKNHYATPFFVRDEFYRGGDDYIDALYDNNDGSDQKIGSFKVNFYNNDNESLGTRTFHTRNEYNETLDRLEKKYGDNFSSAMTDEEYRKMIEETPFGSSFNPKKFEKEANKLDKQFKSKYGDREYYDSDKIDEWLDRDENKKMEEAYASIMDKAFGEKSKEIKEIFKDYDDHNEEYVSKAAICDALSYGDDLDEIASEVHWFLSDDGDQGDRNSYAYYMHEKGYTPEQVAQKDKEAQEAWNEGSTVAKQLSRYYNPTTLYMKNELQNEIFDQVNNRYNKKNDYSIYRISEAADSSGQFVKDHVKVANDFSKKLAPSCSDGNGWYYFNQAIQNLDMGAVDYRNITPADWDKINAEINKLKQ